jgi:hypothetical protein
LNAPLSALVNVSGAVRVIGNRGLNDVSMA